MSLPLISLENSVLANYKLRNELRDHYFAPLDAAAVPMEYAETYLKWRKLSSRMQYSGPCAWLVRPGFSFFENAASSGPCFGGFKILKHSYYFDEPTRESVVFWIPKVLPGTLNKTMRTQKAALDLFRSDYDLPNSHLTYFGSMSLLTGLMLNYFRLTKMRTPAGEQYVRTCSLTPDRSRFSLGWYKNELLFELWRGDDQRFPSLGIFPVGIEPVILPPLD